ncbi:MAG: aminotransferase class I/II-fold pyridoxal phosphate-dependent enzyme [Vicinamibacterales bacterium]
MSLQRDRSYREATRLLQGAFQLDQSTSVTDLGSLFVWHGDKPVQQLKRQLADAYGVVWSFPSTHGTTALNILALLTACPPGGRVLINRDAHSSVTAALIQGGFHPVYLLSEYDRGLGLSLGPTLDGFRDALRRHEIDCVLLTSPNYFGIVGELARIVNLAHERGLPVVVDAAHAPHFHFCRALPDGAEDLGADLVTQSTHKVASAMSQGSLLLIGNTSFIEPLYEHVNELGLVSTSFSYPILASIELGVRQLVEEGDFIWTRTIERAEAFRTACRNLRGVTCFGREQAGRSGCTDLDPTRITLNVSGTGFTGFEFERQLNQRRIYPEMATLEHVLFLLTPGTSDEDLNTVLRALRMICKQQKQSPRGTAPLPPPLPHMAVIPRVAKFSPKRAVPLREAIGKVCGETVATYPPGAPVIVAGEVLSQDVVEYLRCLKASGAVLKGASDSSFQTLKVLST